MWYLTLFHIHLLCPQSLSKNIYVENGLVSSKEIFYRVGAAFFPSLTPTPDSRVSTRFPSHSYGLHPKYRSHSNWFRKLNWFGAFRKFNQIPKKPKHITNIWREIIGQWNDNKIDPCACMCLGCMWNNRDDHKMHMSMCCLCWKFFYIYIFIVRYFFIVLVGW